MFKIASNAVHIVSSLGMGLSGGLLIGLMAKVLLG
jgi:hypothetical protein